MQAWKAIKLIILKIAKASKQNKLIAHKKVNKHPNAPNILTHVLWS
jgi:hypothetical protein